MPSHERFQPPAGCGHIDSISSLEAAAAYSMRTLQRFVGQCNVVTHIKEAAFVGPDDHIVACGSDRGNVFLFDSITGELLRVLAADEEVANCVQCHPTLPVLATSGLEYVVRAPITPLCVIFAGTNGCLHESHSASTPFLFVAIAVW